MSRKRRRSATPLFLCLSAALLLALVFVGLNALSKSENYAYEASLTPTPSPTPRMVSVTRDPSAVTATPAPTALLIQSGARGDTVLALQKRLSELGYYSGEIDGQFGAGTKNAVIWFQNQHGLQADGIVGEKTYELLFSSSAQQAAATPTPAATDVLAGNAPLLVNRAHTLNASFFPTDLVYLRDVCPEGLVKIKGSEIQGVRTAVDALIGMLTAAQADGVDNWQVSAGYRSYGYQKTLFDQKVAQFVAQGYSKASAVSSARVTVADPGASEHHTGLAFDMTVPGQTFADTKQCAWLHEHCWDYGFIIRYTDDKQRITGFTGEAWHIRYVGPTHSKAMRDLGYCLEEYVDYLAGASA